MQIIVPRMFTLTGLTLSGVLFEWPWMKEKRQAAKEIERLLPAICDLLEININASVKIWVRKHGALHTGSFYSNRTRQISLSLAETEIILPRIEFFQELLTEFKDYNVNWYIFTLAHELAHHYQHTNGLIFDSPMHIHWNGMAYDLNAFKGNHFDKPWEIDANARAKKVLWGLIERGLL